MPTHTKHAITLCTPSLRWSRSIANSLMDLIPLLCPTQPSLRSTSSWHVLELIWKITPLQVTIVFVTNRPRRDFRAPVAPTRDCWVRSSLRVVAVARHHEMTMRKADRLERSGPHIIWRHLFVRRWPGQNKIKCHKSFVPTHMPWRAVHIHTRTVPTTMPIRCLSKPEDTAPGHPKSCKRAAAWLTKKSAKTSPLPSHRWHLPLPLQDSQVYGCLMRPHEPCCRRKAAALRARARSNASVSPFRPREP